MIKNSANIVAILVICNNYDNVNKKIKWPNGFELNAVQLKSTKLAPVVDNIFQLSQQLYDLNLNWTELAIMIALCFARGNGIQDHFKVIYNQMLCVLMEYSRVYRANEPYFTPNILHILDFAKQFMCFDDNLVYVVDRYCRIMYLSVLRCARCTTKVKHNRIKLELLLRHKLFTGFIVAIEERSFWNTSVMDACLNFEERQQLAKVMKDQTTDKAGGSGQQPQGQSQNEESDINKAIKDLKEYAKNCKKYQHKAVRKMFNSETETSSSVTFRIVNSSQKVPDDTLYIETNKKYAAIFVQ
ncbi:hypothetical protein B4U80_13721 [Leptotrombidium deliense]|uniref:Uncharacterized protein n=1 Tax=Leptotrombidium deliense TaxID=299467 RepID=A0A443SIS7_9ACAR|nr:hypothetical protein B4U80_13721 [Leptotrombidium deliense]